MTPRIPKPVLAIVMLNGLRVSCSPDYVDEIIPNFKFDKDASIDLSVKEK